MKKILLCSALLVFFFNAKAQITLEHLLDSTGVPYFYYTDLGSNDYKYVFLNRTLNSFSLYNLDMSPYLLNINIPFTSDSLSQGFGVIYITKSLFDCDSTNIEYVYENPYDIKHKFRVLRTDGTLLFQIDSANGPYYLGGGIYGGSNDFKPIVNTASGTKLFLQKYGSNQVPQILVYSLCGSLPANIFDFSNNMDQVKIFPNPTNIELNFEVNLPNNVDVFQISVFDNTSKEHMKKSFELINGRCTIDVRDFSDGVYFYSLSSKNKVYRTGKFTIIK